MNPIKNKYYKLSMSGKDAYLSDAKAVLRLIYEGHNPDQIRQLVVEENLLDYEALQTRRTHWAEISRRYFSGRDQDNLSTLARFVTLSTNPKAVDLILFYEYCQVDPLLHDLTAFCTYELYQSARTGINKVDINEWLSQQESEHPEITGWSPQTRARLTRGYLATIRDSGLIKGSKQKEFYKFYVPREAFVYALYHQKDRGIGGKALIQSTDWRLLLLSESEVIFMLQDAANGGFIHFRHAGDIYDLRFVYQNLKEVVDVITA